jgi:hypothetical protein
MIPPQSREVWRGPWGFLAPPEKLQWLEFEFLGQANSNRRVVADRTPSGHLVLTGRWGLPEPG